MNTNNHFIVDGCIDRHFANEIWDAQLEHEIDDNKITVWADAKALRTLAKLDALTKDEIKAFKKSKAETILFI